MTAKNIDPEASLDEVGPALPMSYDDETAESPAFDLDAWLAGATVMTASVDIVQNAGLLGRYAAWERRYEAAKENSTETGDETLDYESPLDVLAAEGADLRRQIEASTATWFVRALDSEERQAVFDAHPLPENAPTFTEPAPRLVPSPTQGQSDAYLKGMTAWEARRDRWIKVNEAAILTHQKNVQTVQRARMAELITRAVTRIEVKGRAIAESGEVGPAITYEQAAGLIKAIGEVQVGKIGDAINAATESEPEVPADFLPSN